MALMRAGTRVHGYVVDRLLGAGGTAEVYAVRHALTGLPYALKVMTGGHLELGARLAREAAVLTSLEHRHVVRCQGFLEVAGRPSLLLELVEGPDLAVWRREDGRVAEVGTLLELFAGVLRGVAAAHEHGLIHRDLKPANVLLAPTPRGLLPKVADFGMAKLLTPEGMREHLTRTGVVMGTLGFMAPEQMVDSKRVDHRGDIWALGCLLYELLTLRPAFPGSDLPLVRKFALRSLYLPPEQVRPDLPQGVPEAVAAALRPEPGDRPQTCGELAALLAPALPGAFDGIGGALPERVGEVETAVLPDPEPTVMPSAWSLDDDG